MLAGAVVSWARWNRADLRVSLRRGGGEQAEVEVKRLRGLDAGAVPPPAVDLSSFPGARVLLMGTGHHAPHSTLPDVPAVAGTLADLRAALVGGCGLAERAIRVVIDPATPQVMGEAIAEAADGADGLLVVYYIGHGLRMDGRDVTARGDGLGGRMHPERFAASR